MYKRQTSSECNLNKFFSSFESASRICSRNRGHRQTYVDPSGEVRGCSVGCILGMPEISHFVFIVAASRYMGFLEPKKFFSRGDVLGAAEISGVLTGPKSLFCFRSIGCQFERYAAHRKPPFSALCCKKQQQKTPRAQQHTSSLLIPCVDGKLNIKHHRTTPKPEIHTSITAEKDEAALTRK